MSIDSLLGKNILNLQSGGVSAIVDQAIIDPRTLKIVAFFVARRGVRRNDTVLHTMDIRDAGQQGLVIDDDSKLMPLDDLVRLQEVIAFNFSLVGLKVRSEDGQKLGKVSGYSVDTTEFIVEQVYTTHPLLKSLGSNGSTISRSQIVSVDNNKMIVRSTKDKRGSEKPSFSNEFVNPFRRTSQPEGTTTD